MHDECAALHRIMDFVDVDSEKWSDYARRMSWPRSWIYRREGRLLRRWERQVAATFDRVLLCTSTEADLFRGIAPDSTARVNHVPNGVDCEYFSPERDYPNPYDAGQTVFAFTGAMDYWANVDAVQFFVASVLPQLRQRVPDVCFVIVGSNPTAEVEALANGSDVIVTGRVPDVRPYVAHARAIVVPLRIARGIQNKVLEGMAMAKPLVVSSQALEGIKAEVGSEILIADNASSFADALCLLVSGSAEADLGANARKRVLGEWEWSASLRQLGAFVDA
jgi:sugar transferase (PEP-CTERM/EpsH1 system associated)